MTEHLPGKLARSDVEIPRREYTQTTEMLVLVKLCSTKTKLVVSRSRVRVVARGVWSPKAMWSTMVRFSHMNVYLRENIC